VLVGLAHRYHEGAIVVTSDRTVQDAARRTGAIAVDSDAFVGALHADAGPGSRGDDEPDDDRPGPKRGNPRRMSRDERAKLRALDRLRGR
jgi:uncharacterized protein